MLRRLQNFNTSNDVSTFEATGSLSGKANLIPILIIFGVLSMLNNTQKSTPDMHQSVVRAVMCVCELCHTLPLMNSLLVLFSVHTSSSYGFYYVVDMYIYVVRHVYVTVCLELCISFSHPSMYSYVRQLDYCADN